MPKKLRFLITDGYPEPSREKFNDVGMRLAWELYRDMLGDYVPDAEVDVWFASDAPSDAPAELASYDGLLWPGCSLTVFDVEKESVTSQHDLVRRAYEEGIPQFGTCWGIQIAVYVAGGTVRPHPRGREMGIGRKMRLTEAGRNHPMFRGKPLVYSHFVSHDDEVTELPPGATLLAGNDFSRVQAVEVKYERGVFWGIQYHPEYDLHEMARLIVAREERLVKQGLFRDHDDLVQYVDRLEALAADPERKDLRWQLGIDDDILRDDIRQCEFVNWLRDQVEVEV
ncbi:MAG: type 1 glutamine amidotransferase [Phycisphaerales bacterium]|nr:MAG: type 1 glutamine amidotransferase [Phycisphaerales bacterium]